MLMPSATTLSELVSPCEPVLPAAESTGLLSSCLCDEAACKQCSVLSGCRGANLSCELALTRRALAWGLHCFREAGLKAGGCLARLWSLERAGAEFGVSGRHVKCRPADQAGASVTWAAESCAGLQSFA